MINQQELVKKVKNSFNHIFKNADPFGRMFNNFINQKIVLCRTDGYYLSREQFDALMNAVKSLGESSFYLAITEDDFPSTNFDHQNDYKLGPWELSSKISYEEYINIPLVLENALFSTNGTWGVIISHEDHAVIGGLDNFIELFKTEYADWKQGLKNFVEMCEYNKKNYKSDLAWLPNFLNYISPSK